MSNMSYCRFENTLSDLQNCYDNMDSEDLSKQEHSAREDLIKLCNEIAQRYSDDFDEMFAKLRG